LGGGSVVLERDEKAKWVYETKTNMMGEKIYSHTLCLPCHKQWKKGTLCPEWSGGGAGEKME